jgi:hypothetical protein
VTAAEVLAELLSRRVELAVVGDRLRFRPVQAVTADLLAELREHKAEVVELVTLQCWPEESLDSVRRFRQPHARLFPFLGRAVATPQGPGKLLGVFADMAAVALDTEPARAVFFLPSDIRPPGLAHLPGEPFEAVKG